MIKKIRLIGTRALVEKIESNIDSPSKIIYIPLEYRKDHQLARLVLISEDGRKKIQNMVKEGDYVLIRRLDTGFEFSFDDEDIEKKYLNIDAGCIMAKVEGVEEYLQ